MCTLVFTVVQFTMAKLWKQCRLLPSIDGSPLVDVWIKKIWHISHEKNEILSFVATWMD